MDNFDPLFGKSGYICWFSFNGSKVRKLFSQEKDGELIVKGKNHRSLTLVIRCRLLFCADFPGVSREKQNSNCLREKSLFCEAVDNLAQTC